MPGTVPEPASGPAAVPKNVRWVMLGVMLGTGLYLPLFQQTVQGTSAANMALVGAGLGFAMQMAGTIAQNSVSLRDMGAAMSSVNLFRSLGGSLGVAVFGSLFTRAVQGHLPAGGTDLDTTAL
ncbi:hypothetical protein [Streptosporangium carneum]|uniref:MFS transporter n=1 Tax=Streptosporangium carneum TaxID=47481 RepID=A0A9W6HZC1_9ACTN|nr:hypothetical protein [Streptosporangium carneum]GLK09152.1 hypothetical protein GCM10017600_25580 [Streptosporangium carneum]